MESSAGHVQARQRSRFALAATLAIAALSLLALPLSQARGQGADVIIGGRVISEFGTPVGGANVLVPELSLAARVAADGRYRIVVPAARAHGQTVTLRVQMIGHSPQEKRLVLTDAVQTHDFVLRHDVNRLDEVVVTGTVTGTARNKLAFSVVTLDSSDLLVASVNPLRALQGKVPGAHIVQPSGRPGSSPAIVMRGPKALDASGRSQEPLILLDGIIVNGGLTEIAADDIESIEVLKGAAAASLYGSRASAGVIQVTTRSARRAREGTHFTVKSEFGGQRVTGSFDYPQRHFQMMDERNERFCIKGAAAGVAALPICSRVVDLEDEARRINENASSWADAPYQFERDYTAVGGVTNAELKGLFQVNRFPREYDQLAMIARNGLLASNTVNVTARSNRMALFGSVTDLVDQGAIRFLGGYRRRSARVNLDHAVSDVVTLGVSSTLARSTQYGSGSAGALDLDVENFYRAVRVPRGVNLLRRDPLGHLYVRPNPLSQGGEGNNALYDFETAYGATAVDRFAAAAQVRYTPAAWLDFDATASTDRRTDAGQVFMDRGYRTNGPPQGSQFLGYGFIDQSSLSDISHNVALNGRATLSGERWRGAITSRYTLEKQDIASTAEQGWNLAVPGVRTLGNARENVVINSSNRSIRAMGAMAGAQVDYADRYILDGSVRLDGSSLFGASERWHPYRRASVAWRISEEPFWPAKGVANELKLRASVGTAGARPRFSAQYESFAITGGAVTTVGQMGNKNLKPETTLETELGIDAELFNRYGVTLTYARDITRDQLLPVPSPAASGFAAQWRNAGTLDGTTWELSLRLPIVNRSSFGWTTQLAWDRNRTMITALNTEPFEAQVAGPVLNNTIRFLYAPGERYGAIRGWQYVTRCAQLPAPFDTQCGDGKEWQINDEGYVVWVGAGNTPGDGVRLNLWQAVRPGCMVKGVGVAANTQVACQQLGGVVNSPWGAPATHWGMPTLVRDSVGQPVFGLLGNTMPDYHASMSHSVRWRRASAYALVDAVVGYDVFNQERQWSMLTFTGGEQDQDGKTPETAKPIGYYWRGPGAPISQGVGGFYGQLVANNRTVEDGSYARLRELSVTYDIGDIGRFGRWSVSVAGRNLATWTRYTGWDPEVGLGGGQPGSAAITAFASYQYPQSRSFTFSLTGGF